MFDSLLAQPLSVKTSVMNDKLTSNDIDSIDEFDPCTINAKDCHVIAVLGTRLSGKTTLMTDIISNMSDQFDDVYGFWACSQTVDCFKQYIPQNNIKHHTSIDNLNDIMKTQLTCLDRGEPQPKLLIVIDDCIFSSKLSSIHRSILNSLVQHTKRYNITLIVSEQLVKGLDQLSYNYISHLFCTKSLVHSNDAHKLLFDRCGGDLFENLPTFSKMFDKYTADYSTMVLLRETEAMRQSTAVMSQPRNRVKWYKSKVDIPSFSIGKGASN